MMWEMAVNGRCLKKNNVLLFIGWTSFVGGIKVDKFCVFPGELSSASGSGFMQSSSSEEIVVRPIEKLKLWPDVKKRYIDLISTGDKEEEEEE